MSRRIFVLRHGETEFNSEKKLQGHCNSSLTERGTIQAKNFGRALKEYLSGIDFDVYSSPLGRAVQTARLACNELGYPIEAIIEDARLKEFNLGEWEQRKIPGLVKEHPDLLAKNDWYLRAPKSETYDAVKSRLVSWLSDVPASRNIVVISHGLTGIVLRGLLLNLDYDAVWEQDLPQDVFFIIENETVKRVSCVARNLVV